MKKIKEIALMIGTQGDGYFDNVIKFENEKVKISVENYMYHEYEEKTLDINKDEFLEKFNSLNVEEWEDSYILFGTIQGYSWELNVFYEDGSKLVKKGANEYPENMDVLTNLIDFDTSRFDIVEE